jgi:glycosyltransferase involved in cell wall biosynthesis
MNATPSVSVVICTHERSDDLARCLAAAAPQVHAQGWDLVVADSASSPAHARELVRLSAAHGAAYERLDAPGLSRARNRGAALARGDWVAYLDDDAIPQPSWAERLSQALRAQPERVAMLGGRIDPLWPEGVKRDYGVTARGLLLLSCVERAGEGRVADGWNLCGANFAVRRAALEAIGGFPEDLGRVGTRLIGGEESYVVQRLERDGLDARYDGSFGVQHRIEPARLSCDWLRRRAFWEGVTRIAVLRALGEPLPPSLWSPKLWASIPALWLFARLRAANPDWTIRLELARGSAWALWQRVGAAAVPIERRVRA